MKSHLTLLIALALLHTSAFAQNQEAKLANQLSNPVAALISVPIQYTLDEKIGPTEEGEVTVIKASPVVPFELNNDWNIITRTIIPVIDQENIPVNGQGESGLGDIAASFFFSPKAPTNNGWIWGAEALSCYSIQPVKMRWVPANGVLGPQPYYSSKTMAGHMVH